MAAQPFSSTHSPAALQERPAAQVPHTPPQPSAPQALPMQSGAHAASHTPAGPQEYPAAHVPQAPPHPSSPHALPAHSGVQTRLQPAAIIRMVVATPTRRTIFTERKIAHPTAKAES
jgi:hypothetical protein